MPSISVVGNRSPVSTTTSRPSYSMTVMFLPISPRPPSGRTLRASVTLELCNRFSRARRLKQPVTLEHLAHRCELVCVEFDVRQPRRTDIEPHQLQSRLHGGGERGDGEIAVGVLERGVDLPAAPGLVNHAMHV